MRPWLLRTWMIVALVVLSECTAPPPPAGTIETRPTDGMAMVYVPAGEFIRGSDRNQIEDARKLCKSYRGESAIATCRHTAFANELPAHTVSLDGFWIDRTEVTNGQYRQCVQVGDCAPPVESGSFTRDYYYGDSAYDDYPVIWVRWDQAAAYCAWAGARLPTEAEWEYAARGPEGLIFPWGDTFDGSRLNYCDADCGGVNDETVDDGYPDTAPVGSFPAGTSWCGAMDMAGNVREWVADWYKYYPTQPQVNPTGPSVGDSRIPRGGSWYDTPDDVRSANRGENAPDYTRHKVGFRCAQDQRGKPAPTPTSPTDTLIPPTSTPIPPTATPSPPTATPIPPTAAPTPMPPTSTPIPPTPTLFPPTDTVCASGCDFVTIQAAIDDAGITSGAIVEITDPIHTEAGIVINKDVTIRGLGAANTIVQANATLEGSPNRVFIIAEGAAVTIRDLTIRHGNPPLDENWRYGGGVANRGTLMLENCIVSHNIANNGGGIWSKGGLTVVNCTISHNIADRIATEEDIPNAGTSPQACGSGGGIKLVKGGTLTLDNSTIHNNEAKSHGGGIFVACETTATLTNCTISGNRATTWGGGLYTKNVLRLTHCTVANNHARATCASGQMANRCPQDKGGGGVYVRDTLHFTNTIIANNGPNLDCVLAPAGTYGMLESGKIGVNVNNLVGDGSCDATHSGDPLLGSLAENGGPIQTYALLAGSPAIDAISAISCTLSTDQRGAPRPVAHTSPDTPCDIGAFEAQTEGWPID